MNNAYNQLMGLQTNFPSEVMNAREWFLHYYEATNEIPAEIKLRLQEVIDGSGLLKVRESVVYTKVKAPTAVTQINLFNETLQVKKGVRNLRNARLEKNQIFLARGMRMRFGTKGGTTTDSGTPAAFSATEATAENEMAVLKYEGLGKDPVYDCINSAELNVKVGSEILVHELSATVFDTGLKQVQDGYFLFDKPILIHPDKKIEAYLEFGDAAHNNLTTGVAIHFEFIGVQTY